MPPTPMPLSLPLARFKRGILLLLLALTAWAAIVIAHAIYITGHTPAAMHSALIATLGQGFLILVSFAAFTALDHARLRLLAITGIVGAALMLAIVPVYAWWEISDLRPLPSLPRLFHARAYQLAATGTLSAGILCLVPFVLIPRVRRIARIIQWTTILYLFFAYLAALLYLWHIDTRRTDETLTTLLIPAAVCMLAIFIQQKFIAIRHPDPLSSVAPTLLIRCPRCQCEQSVTLGDSRCCQCRLHFSIAVEEPRCPNCHFNLHLLTHPTCPECGTRLDADDVPPLPSSPLPPQAQAPAIPPVPAPQV